MFSSMLTKHFGIHVPDEENNGLPRLLCSGDAMIRFALHYGVESVVHGDLLKKLIRTKFADDRKRKEDDIARGLEFELGTQKVKKNRYTRDHNIPERRDDNKEFKDVVKAANTLQMGPLLAEKLRAVWYDHEQNEYTIAGALLPGTRRYDDGRCWGHIYGPLFCGNKLDADMRTPKKKCWTCWQFYHRSRYLCDGCCKQREMSEKTYCLTEQCPAKKEEFAFGPGPTAH